MNSAAVTSVLVMLVSLITTLFIAGDACDKVPTMTMNDACHKACDNQPWYSLCPYTLKNAPVTAEVTTYAIVAARLAKIKYDEVMPMIDDLLADGSLSAKERAALGYCWVKCGEARRLMASVEDQLVRCDFTHAKQEYMDAKDAVQSCKRRIRGSFHGLTMLLPMVTANRDLTMVAYELGTLVVGK